MTGSVKQLLLILLGVAQLKGCVTLFCESANDPYPPRSVRLDAPASQRLVDAGVLADGTMLFATGDPETAGENSRTVLRWNERTGSEPLTALRGRFSIGERLFAKGNHWSYTVAGAVGNRWGALFVDGDATSASPAAFVELPLEGPAVWLPLQGSPPRGLYVSQGFEQSRFFDVGANGIQHRWTLTERHEVHPRWWTAQALRDGTIAVISMEPTRLMLRMLDPNDARELVLREGQQFGEIASAISEDGLIAVAAQTSKGIDAAVIDPRSPANPRWLEIGAAGDTPPFLRVLANDHDFTVTWTEHHGSTVDLRARSITAASAELLTSTVRSRQQRGDSAIPFIAIRQESDVLFAWDADGVAIRRIPRPLAGHQLFAVLRDRSCRTGKP